jgi:RNA polymerase sigma-70 factor (ECF subfamily)
MERRGHDTHTHVTLLFPLFQHEPPDIAALYDAHARQIWRVLVRLGVPSSHVEDAVQDVFLTAHQNRRKFLRRSQPSTWLIGIAVGIAANLRRKKSSSQGAANTPWEGAEPQPSPYQHLESQARLHELELFLARLPEDQREIVVLVDLEEMTAPQVAAALQVNLNTVYSRLRLGRAALTHALKAKMESAV